MGSELGGGKKITTKILVPPLMRIMIIKRERTGKATIHEIISKVMIKSIHTQIKGNKDRKIPSFILRAE